MRITNNRCGWSVGGKYIEVIPPNTVPTDDQMLAFWHLKPGDARFADHAVAMRYGRLIIQKHNDNFIIVPLTPDISEVIK